MLAYNTTTVIPIEIADILVSIYKILGGKTHILKPASGDPINFFLSDLQEAFSNLEASNG